MPSDSQRAGLSLTEPDGIREEDAYYWRCHRSGWLGTGCSTLDSAMREAGDHIRSDHQEMNDVLVVRKDSRHA